jgi:hypothetical protein
MSRAQLTSTVEQNTGGAVAPYVAGKNILINGGQDFWQRGTSIAVANVNFAYTSDRWIFFSQNGSGTVNRQASGLTGFNYSARVQRTAGQTATSGNTFIQGVESSTAIYYAGATVTLSFYAKAGANYSASGSGLGVNIYTGAGTDENPAYGYTGQANPLSQTATLTTSWQRFSFTGTVNSIGGKTIGTGSYLDINFGLTNNTTQTIDIWGIQLEAGSVATPFTTATGTLSGELAACQRYYHRIVAAGSSGSIFAIIPAVSTTSWIFSIPLSVPLRVAATSIETSNIQITTYGTNNYSGGTYTVSGYGTTINGGITYTKGGADGGISQSQMGVLNNSASGGYVAFSAEL